jgi:arabinan endo-1,5-alpha-L-arabinosidase
MTLRAAGALLCAALLAACAGAPERGAGLVASTYSNPVLDRDFPDPAVLRAPDARIYAYATQAYTASGVLNIQVARSRDLVNWAHLGDALPRKPAWAATKQHFWAPHVHYDGLRYVMYYSAEPDAARGKCLAVAVSAAPEGPFADTGSPLLCGEGDEHIDPMAFDDPRTGSRLLYWGSGAKPIRVQELAPDRLHFLPGSEAREIAFPDGRTPYGSLIEGAWVSYRHGNYYLYYSGDRCCGPAPRYAVMVARASSARGPFEPYREPDASGASAILARNGFWNAPGHNSVITDDAGNDWMLYHAVDAGRAYFEDRVHGRSSNRVMLLDPISYRDGWPRVGGPSTGPRDGPVMRGGTPD